MASGRRNRNQYLGLLLFGSCKLCTLLQPERQEQILPLSLLHWKGKLSLPIANSLGPSQTLNDSYLTSYICFQRISDHFITHYLTSILLCQVHVGTVWPLQKHSPFDSGTSPELCPVSSSSGGRVCVIWHQTEGWGSSRATVWYQGWDLLQWISLTWTTEQLQGTIQRRRTPRRESVTPAPVPPM